MANCRRTSSSVRWRCVMSTKLSTTPNAREFGAKRRQGDQDLAMARARLARLNQIILGGSPPLRRDFLNVQRRRATRDSANQARNAPRSPNRANASKAAAVCRVIRWRDRSTPCKLT
jgi:hypothetical protein